MSPLLASVEVRTIERLSPSFVRLELGGADLAHFGVDGPLYDQRIKLLIPGPAGLPELGADTWWADWCALPEATRGHVRTYTVREVRGCGPDTRLVVDVVLHPGAHGPGSSWAARASVGDRALVLCPRRGTPFGGIEFAPCDAERLLLAGDETAVPAIAAILSLLPADARGAAFLEVPLGGDVQPLLAPPDVAINWLPRAGAPLGCRLTAAVLAHLGGAAMPTVADDEVDPDLWETPSYSSSGEPLARGDRDGLYAWVAGESKVVTGLRRALVADLGLKRSQVAFMGYWREGVAMRS
ncbi:NADPH-dependent ferric siderophore reductase, contains FAD-binding and SIP domains [Nocardioides terrae]|uniref:NADPH-dependent ferric siderophore reductase, contains FAD-binding and SIP domains n=1 Tax=Nocardioides terrae TaxID=574651 RepID=A0A1I1EZK5_9ACTN|nr:siderophore-interacting protein [Nocardioides terrae]SFB90360.1 NADPH-dependent ferric siderophore reductase, contains FAD-binding and SIP domains [Nocardioides terrae]